MIYGPVAFDIFFLPFCRLRLQEKILATPQQRVYLFKYAFNKLYKVEPLIAGGHPDIPETIRQSFVLPSKKKRYDLLQYLKIGITITGRKHTYNN